MQHSSRKLVSGKRWQPDVSIESRLWNLYKLKKSDEIRNRIAEYYSGYVLWVARRVAKNLPPCSELDGDDLYHAGMLILLTHCIPLFEDSAGVPFLAFANSFVRGAMIDHIRKVTHCRNRVRMYSMSNLGINGVSFDNGNGASESRGFEFQIIDHREQTADRSEINKDLVRRVLRGLSPVESRLMRMYHMDGLTMKQVGKKLGMSESRVSQMHSQIMKHLRQRDCAAEFLGN